MKILWFYLFCFRSKDDKLWHRMKKNAERRKEMDNAVSEEEEEKEGKSDLEKTKKEDDGHDKKEMDEDEEVLSHFEKGKSI